ncbi:MAG: hypothetical protein NW226_25835 [Microscillaceae bacterium]|nr:hypothetical protein [Microscillaceae bacterium]
MNIYYYATNSDVFHYIDWKKVNLDETQKLRKIFDEDDPIDLAYITSLEQEMMRYTEDTREGDFLSFASPSGVICTPRAWRAIQDLIMDYVEAFSFRVEGHDYVLIHPRETLDALDEANSEVDYYSDGSIFDIYQYTFFPEKLKGKHLFRIPQTAGLHLYISEVFKQRVEQHQLMGLVSKRVLFSYEE